MRQFNLNKQNFLINQPKNSFNISSLLFSKFKMWLYLYRRWLIMTNRIYFSQIVFKIQK